jgi:hypothetical protein
MKRSNAPACAALEDVAALASGTLNARAICATSCGLPLSWRCLRAPRPRSVTGPVRAGRQRVLVHAQGVHEPWACNSTALVRAGRHRAALSRVQSGRRRARLRGAGGRRRAPVVAHRGVVGPVGGRGHVAQHGERRVALRAELRHELGARVHAHVGAVGAVVVEVRVAHLGIRAVDAPPGRGARRARRARLTAARAAGKAGFHRVLRRPSVPALAWQRQAAGRPGRALRGTIVRGRRARRPEGAPLGVGVGAVDAVGRRGVDKVDARIDRHDGRAHGVDEQLRGAHRPREQQLAVCRTLGRRRRRGHRG